jgi:hypothetical protein
MYLAIPLTLTLALCPPASVYLRWLSPLGEWCGWLFAGDVDTSTELTDPTDLATADTRTTVALRRAGTDKHNGSHRRPQHRAACRIEQPTRLASGVPPVTQRLTSSRARIG